MMTSCTSFSFLGFPFSVTYWVRVAGSISVTLPSLKYTLIFNVSPYVRIVAIDVRGTIAVGNISAPRSAFMRVVLPLLNCPRTTRLNTLFSIFSLSSSQMPPVMLSIVKMESMHFTSSSLRCEYLSRTIINLPSPSTIKSHFVYPKTKKLLQPPPLPSPLMGGVREGVGGVISSDLSARLSELHRL